MFYVYAVDSRDYSVHVTTSTGHGKRRKIHNKNGNMNSSLKNQDSKEPGTVGTDTVNAKKTGTPGTETTDARTPETTKSETTKSETTPSENKTPDTKIISPERGDTEEKVYLGAVEETQKLPVKKIGEYFNTKPYKDFPFQVFTDIPEPDTCGGQFIRDKILRNNFGESGESGSEKHTVPIVWEHLRYYTEAGILNEAYVTHEQLNEARWNVVKDMLAREGNPPKIQNGKLSSDNAIFFMKASTTPSSDVDINVISTTAMKEVFMKLFYEFEKLMGPYLEGIQSLVKAGVIKEFKRPEHENGYLKKINTFLKWCFDANMYTRELSFLYENIEGVDRGDFEDVGSFTVLRNPTTHKTFWASYWRIQDSLPSDATIPLIHKLQKLNCKLDEKRESNMTSEYVKTRLEENEIRKTADDVYYTNSAFKRDAIGVPAAHMSHIELIEAFLENAGFILEYVEHARDTQCKEGIDLAKKYVKYIARCYTSAAVVLGDEFWLNLAKDYVAVETFRGSPDFVGKLLETFREKFTKEQLETKNFNTDTGPYLHFVDFIQEDVLDIVTTFIDKIDPEKITIPEKEEEKDEEDVIRVLFPEPKEDKGLEPQQVKGIELQQNKGLEPQQGGMGQGHVWGIAMGFLVVAASAFAPR